MIEFMHELIDYEINRFEKIFFDYDPNLQKYRLGASASTAVILNLYTLV